MIKLIATDMDGTWLNDDKDYDRELFKREFLEMRKRDIKFVVASGNQYANLMTRFPDVVDQIYFVAENGALVAQGKQILHVDALSDDLYQTLLKITDAYDYAAIVMRLVSAYVKMLTNPVNVQEITNSVDHLEVVDSFAEFNDLIFKIVLTFPAVKMLVV